MYVPASQANTYDYSLWLHCPAPWTNSGKFFFKHFNCSVEMINDHCLTTLSYKKTKTKDFVER